MKTNRQIKKEINKLLDEVIYKCIHSPNTKTLKSAYRIFSDVESNAYRKMNTVKNILHKKLLEQHNV